MKQSFWQNITTQPRLNQAIEKSRSWMKSIRNFTFNSIQARAAKLKLIPKSQESYVQAMTPEELQALVIQNAQAISSLTAAIASQERLNTDAFNSLKATAESQSRSLEFLREEALTSSKSVDRLEQHIDRLEQMVEIIIKDNQADHLRYQRSYQERIRRLED